LDGRVQVIDRYAFAYGGYADIYCGVISDRNTVVAIKVFRDAHLKAQSPELQRKYAKRLNKEYRVWALLRHPNVLPLLGLIDHPSIPSTGIVAPRCSYGDLRSLFARQIRPAQAVNRLAIVIGVASGLAYVHENEVVHGDLTMNNILIELINGTFTPLLSDFGRSRVLEQAGYTTSIGNAVHRHMPPEILTVDDEHRSTKAFTQAADVWCFGMVMLETLTGKPPFFGMNELQAATAVAYKHEKPDQNRYPAFPHHNTCWQIMRECWHKDPSRRQEMCNLLQYLNAVR